MAQIVYNICMKISIITLFPKMISSFLDESIVRRAKEKGAVEIEIVDLRKFAKNKYGSVDDRPYGGGAGMVLRVDVLHEALQDIIKDSGQAPTLQKVSGQARMTILTSAKGKKFNQQKAQEYSKLNHLVLIAGHYEGFDERVLDFIDEEISLGDFVMTGGEITAAAVVDSVVRLLPNVLKKEEATQSESFFEVSVDKLIEVVGVNDLLEKLKQKGAEKVKLLEYPHYTRPEEFRGKKVPEVLLKGNHKQVDEWRLKMAYEETVRKRVDLLQ